jgi:hypothetical protein
VVLTIESFLGAGEFIDELDFNYGTNTPNTFAALSTSGPVSTGSFTSPAYSTGSNLFQADGDGEYDIQFAFGTAQADRFDGADTYQITFLNASEAEFFNYSNPRGGYGPFHAAGHIQGIGPNSESGWHSDGPLVPLPPPVYAGGGLLAAIGLVRVVRRRNG